MANDKPNIGKSPIFSFPYQLPLDKNKINYFNSDSIKNAIKYEDITTTLDKRFIIATTAFDRIDPKSNKLDNFNTLLCWKNGDEKNVKIILPINDNGIISSKLIKNRIKESLKNHIYKNGPEYFKIEGLVILPDNKLVFGIREVGNKYSDFQYVVKLISVTFFIENDEIKLRDDFKLCYEFEPVKNKQLKISLGLSSLDYNQKNNMMYFLTSYEDSASVYDGYIWTLDYNDFLAGIAPKLVLNDDGNPFSLGPHKPEGITVIDEKTLLVVYDDDRKIVNATDYKNKRVIERKPNQNAYEIIILKMP